VRLFVNAALDFLLAAFPLLVNLFELSAHVEQDAFACGRMLGHEVSWRACLLELFDERR